MDEELLLRFVERCRKLAQRLAVGPISFEEYASNVMGTAVHPPIEGIPLFVEAVPPDLVASYTDYLRETLEPVDFMPNPSAFILGPLTEEIVSRKKLGNRSHPGRFALPRNRDVGHIRA